MGKEHLRVFMVNGYLVFVWCVSPLGSIFVVWFEVETTKRTIHSRWQCFLCGLDRSLRVVEKWFPITMIQIWGCTSAFCAHFILRCLQVLLWKNGNLQVQRLQAGHIYEVSFLSSFAFFFELRFVEIAQCWGLLDQGNSSVIPIEFLNLILLQCFSVVRFFVIKVAACELLRTFCQRRCPKMLKWWGFEGPKDHGKRVKCHLGHLVWREEFLPWVIHIASSNIEA